MANSDPLIGKQVGNYHILAEINSGSFGSVYRGKHIIFEDDPVVAIKLLHASLHTQQERTEFIKEAQLLKKLRHPYILRILDAGFQENMPYLVTEYAAGGSLRDRLRKYNGQPLPVEEAVAILTQIGQALHYANQQHIVHRDLKPENILFNNQGEALLADFGIAVLLTTAHTGRVGLGGTPPYMAPEQFEGLASPKSDQYALGCIAYELLTGWKLFSIPNPTLGAWWFHHTKVEPVPPRQYNPQLPAHIEQAILIAILKDRVKRHRDISAFIEAMTGTKEPPITEEGVLFDSDHVSSITAKPPVGTTLLTYRGHSAGAMAVSWSPDGGRIASGARDRTVQVWDAETGQTLLTYRGHTDWVHAVAWSPDGRRIASSGADDRTVQVWDAETGQVLVTYPGHADWVYAVAWSPDGRRIASSAGDAQVWDAETGQTLMTYRGHTGEVETVAWSPDGRRIASGAGDVQVWDAGTGQVLGTYRGHAGGVETVAWSPDGKRIASGARDKTVQVWDAATGQALMRGDAGDVEAVAWSPDGRHIAFGSVGVNIWQAE